MNNFEFRTRLDERLHILEYLLHLVIIFCVHEFLNIFVRNRIGADHLALTISVINLHEIYGNTLILVEGVIQ